MVILYTYDKGNYINLNNISLEEMDSRGIKRNIYVNLTNRCPCSCTFCLRQTKEMSESNSLWLKREPTLDEVISEFEKLDLLTKDIEEDNTNKIVKKKSVELKPMDFDEAILQMELLGHDFYVFKDEKTNKTCVLYKRKEQGYGIIEEE